MSRCQVDEGPPARELKVLKKEKYRKIETKAFTIGYEFIR